MREAEQRRCAILEGKSSSSKLHSDHVKSVASKVSAARVGVRAEMKNEIDSRLTQAEKRRTSLEHERVSRASEYFEKVIMLREEGVSV